MRLIDLRNHKYYVKRGLGAIYTIYNDREEAEANGVTNIITPWKFIQGYAPVIEEIKAGRFPWILSDDKFVPDVADSKLRIVHPLLCDGIAIPTEGCVVQVIEYHQSKTSVRNDYIKTPTGTFNFVQKELTTEERANRHAFTKFYSPAFKSGPERNITDRKRKAAFMLLSPLSETYGRPMSSFLAVYPHYKRNKFHVVRIMAYSFFNQEWFHRLLKKDWLMSTLLNDVRSKLEAKGITTATVAELVELAVTAAKVENKAKGLLDVAKELKIILDTGKDSGQPSLPPGMNPAQLPPALSKTIGDGLTLLEPHIDEGHVEGPLSGPIPAEVLRQDERTEFQQTTDDSEAIEDSIEEELKSPDME